MKRVFSCVLAASLALSLLAGCGASSTASSAASGAASSEAASSVASSAVETAALPDGVYTADFDTDSSMFHANEACNGKGTLTVENGQMTFHVSLASTHIVNLYLGQGCGRRSQRVRLAAAHHRHRHLLRWHLGGGVRL